MSHVTSVTFIFFIAVLAQLKLIPEVIGGHCITISIWHHKFQALNKSMLFMHLRRSSCGTVTLVTVSHIWFCARQCIFWLNTWNFCVVSFLELYYLTTKIKLSSLTFILHKVPFGVTMSQALFEAPLSLHIQICSEPSTALPYTHQFIKLGYLRKHK